MSVHLLRGATFVRATRPARGATYQSRIRDLAPLHDPRHIEAFMRVEHSTLDGLSVEQFRDEVLFCAEVVSRAGPQEAERVARSLGL